MTEHAFKSPRLGMRAWRPTDLAAFHGIFGDPRVIWWGKHKASLDESRAALQRAITEQSLPRPGLGRFAAVSEESGSVVGNVILRPASFDEGIEVGYHIAYDAWGRGYATEAAEAAITHGFDVVGLDRIIAAAAIVNARSLHVLKKLGMTPTHEAMHAGLPHRMFERRREAPSGRV